MPYRPGVDPSLPRQRAFVVQLQARAEATPERFAGRVEHVASGLATHFHSLDGFVAFVARVLGDAPARPEQEARCVSGRADAD